jgi:hypothetical protein
VGAIFTQILVANGMEHSAWSMEDGSRFEVQGWEDRKMEIVNGKLCHRLQATRHKLQDAG